MPHKPRGRAPLRNAAYLLDTSHKGHLSLEGGWGFPGAGAITPRKNKRCVNKPRRQKAKCICWFCRAALLTESTTFTALGPRGPKSYRGPKRTQPSSPPTATGATAAPPKCEATNLASMRAVGTGRS